MLSLSDFIESNTICKAVERGSLQSSGTRIGSFISDALQRERTLDVQTDSFKAEQSSCFVENGSLLG
jgi:hypothetical protein